MHHAVRESVERVAFLQHLVGHQFHVGGGEGRLEVRIDRAEGLHVPGVLHRCLGQIEAWVANQDAVKLIGISRRNHHAVAPAVRAPHHVGGAGCLAVQRCYELPGHGRQRAIGCITVVQPGLRVHAEQIAANQAGDRWRHRGVAGIAGQDCKALHQCVGGGSRAHHIAPCRNHHAIVAAVGLQQKTAIPFKRQAHFETDRIGLAVGARARVHAARDLAVRGHGIGLCHAGHDGTRGDQLAAGDAYIAIRGRSPKTLDQRRARYRGNGDRGHVDRHARVRAGHVAARGKNAKRGQREQAAGECFVHGGLRLIRTRRRNRSA